MTTTSLPAILKTRLLVGYLGERAQHGWWDSGFYESSGQLFLEPAFARTSKVTQYHGVLEAARILHDEHLSVGSYHLFRLPEEIEQGLHNLVRMPETDEIVLKELRSNDAAMSSLVDLASGVLMNSVGPAAIGSIDDLAVPRTVNAFAAAYLSAFSQGTKTYPYLTG